MTAWKRADVVGPAPPVSRGGELGSPIGVNDEGSSGPALAKGG